MELNLNILASQLHLSLDVYCSSKVKKNKKLFYVAFTLNQNILIFFFLSSFPFLPIAPLYLVLTFHFYPLPPTKPLPRADRSPNPTPTTLCVLHNSTPLSLCYLMPSASVGLYLAFSLSRSPPQRPNLQAPPSLCYLMPSANVGLCLCLWQWVCVFRSIGILAQLMKFSGVFCLQCFPMWLLWGRRWR